MKKQFYILLALIGFAVSSCEHSTAPPQLPTVSEGNDILINGNKAIVLANGSNSLYVLDLSNVSASDRELLTVNEGDFQKSNSTVDAILFHKSGTNTDTIMESNLLPDSSARLVATISMGTGGPNKMAIIGPNMLLVTRRNTTSAAIVDLSKNQIVDSVVIGEPSVAVAVLNNKAYITSGGYTPPGHLNILNLSSMKIIRSVWLRNTPEQCVVDSVNNQVLIGTVGNYDTINPVNPMIYYVNSASDNVADSLVVGNSESDGEITIGSKHFLIINGDVYPLGAPSHTLPNPLINSASLFYKGFYDPEANELYLGEYNFGGAGGKVDVFNGSTGAQKWSFTTGIAPGHFAFYH